MTSPSKPVAKRWHAWSQAERSHLESLIGNAPLAIVARRYNTWAGMHGFSLRTVNAITSYCNRKNISTEVIGDMLKTSDVARILDFRPSRLRYWIKSKWLPVKRYGCLYVARAQLRQLAHNKPHLFYGVNYRSLYLLLEDEELAEQISRNWTAPFKLRPVRCVELQRTWPSVAAAAADCFCHRRSITKAIRYGRTCLELHWEWAS